MDLLSKLTNILPRYKRPNLLLIKRDNHEKYFNNIGERERELLEFLNFNIVNSVKLFIQLSYLY